MQGQRLAQLAADYHILAATGPEVSEQRLSVAVVLDLVPSELVLLVLRSFHKKAHPEPRAVHNSYNSYPESTEV